MSSSETPQQTPIDSWRITECRPSSIGQYVYGIRTADTKLPDIVPATRSFLETETEATSQGQSMILIENINIPPLSKFGPGFPAQNCLDSLIKKVSTPNLNEGYEEWEVKMWYHPKDDSTDPPGTSKVSKDTAIRLSEHIFRAKWEAFVLREQLKALSFKAVGYGQRQFVHQGKDGQEPSFPPTLTSDGA